jgi:hypothetical protein
VGHQSQNADHPPPMASLPNDATGALLAELLATPATRSILDDLAVKFAPRAWCRRALRRGRTVASAPAP